MEIVKDSYTKSISTYNNFSVYITNISDPSWDFNKAYERRKRILPDSIYPAMTFKIRAYILQRRYLLVLFNPIQFLIESLRTSITPILILMPSFLLYIVFLYDLTLAQIYYTYYALFIYVLSQNLNKFRKFIYEKDFMIT